MDVHKSSLLDIFDSKQRLEVPLFQRQYVWNEDAQWLPLWEDIERKFSDVLEGRTDGPVHFLGAMVLDQKQTPTGHVVRRQVIDGQQRLTTFQIVLSAFRDFCRETEVDDLAEECQKFILNTGMMADPNLDRFKVWPTQLDRPQFVDIVTTGSRAGLLELHPQRWRKWARHPDPRPRMVEAYLFFYSQIEGFFLGNGDSGPIASTVTLSIRLEECFSTLKYALMVAVIDLGPTDDPQVIFETLNARGQPLLPADLLRNYVFLRAARDKLNTEELYKRYWKPFDDEFWRTEVRQGRLTRPRSDLFMQHYLASRQGQDIPIKHLYVEYRHWIERQKPFSSIEEELTNISKQGGHFRRIIEPIISDPVYDLSTFLDSFDVRTAYPFLLALLDGDVEDSRWSEITQHVESYLVRRAFCRMTTKNYNRVFLSLAKAIRSGDFSSRAVRNQLLEQTGESARWPSDTEFEDAWMRTPAYTALRGARIVHVLKRLNQALVGPKSETLVFEVEPTIEHIMPQSWQENWPLPDRSQGLSWQEMLEADADDPSAKQSRNRENIIDTIGNLTILSHELNAAQSNLPWEEKKPELMKHSLLPINQRLSMEQSWNEERIAARARDLFAKAILIWPR